MAQTKKKVTKKAAAPKVAAAPKAVASTEAMPKLHEMHVNPILAIGLIVVLAGVAVAVWQTQMDEQLIAPVVTSTK